MNGWLTTLRLVMARFRAYPMLILLQFVGVLVAVSLVCGISLYTTMMADVLLQARLSPQGRDVTLAVMSSPDSPDQYSYATLSSINRYLRQQASDDLGVPITRIAAYFYLPTAYPVAVQIRRSVSAGPIPTPTPATSLLFNGAGSTAATTGNGVPGPVVIAPDAALHSAAYLEWHSGFASHVQVEQGALLATSRTPDGGVPVAVPRVVADALHLHVGQRLNVALSEDIGQSDSPLLVVAAIYERTSAFDPFWQLSSPPPGADPYEVLSLQAFTDLSQLAASTNPQYSWQVNLPVRAMHYAAVDTMLANVTRFTNQVRVLGPSLQVQSFFGSALVGFSTTFALLGILLYLLAAPVVGIVLFYLTVSTGFVMDRLAGEIVLWRSRGAAARQIVAIYVSEGVVLGAIAVALGPLLGVPISAKISQTSAFLQFGNPSTPAPAPTVSTVMAGALVALLGVIATVGPATSAARKTMNEYKGEQARSVRKPFWQRFYLDGAALLVAMYGYITLVRQGPILPSQNSSVLTQDPFVALAPGLFVLAGALLFGRILPRLSTTVASTLRRAPIELSMAVQTVARTPRQYVRLEMLVILTLSIGIFAAAVAGAAGRNLDDQYRYLAGSDLRLVEDDVRAHQMSALPPAWHRHIDGVRMASPALRFESFQATLTAGDFSSPAEVLGIDPATFGQVAWFRPDFATQSLSTLLTLLRSPTRPGVLVNQNFLDASQARVGDQVQLSAGGSNPIVVAILGVVSYFPSLDPPEHVYAIGNLAFLMALSGTPTPGEMWLRTDGTSETNQRVLDAVQSTGREVASYIGSAPSLSMSDNPLQVGVYGVTSIGIIVAAGLSMLALVAYLYLSMERRSLDFGVLRALGSSTGQVAMIVLLEQLFLLAAGIGAALLIGLLGGRLFIPYLPVAQYASPPVLVNMPWLNVIQLVGILLAAFVLSLSAAAYALSRLQIGRVLRLGEG